MQIQISWLLQKPTDLDLHCLQRQDISGFSRTRVLSVEWAYYKQQPRFHGIVEGNKDNIITSLSPVYLLTDISPDKTLFFNRKVLIFFLFLHENIGCGYSLEAPHWGSSNEYLDICFHGEIRKILCEFHSYLKLWPIDSYPHRTFSVQY